MKKLAHHLRTNVVAYLALFVALGGSSYAAVSLPAGSVGTNQLRDGAVTSRKLAKHAVTAASVDPRSIAGHIAAWAQVRFGNVTSSNPRATLETVGGLPAVTWHKRLRSNCFAIATPNDVVTSGAEVVQTFDPGPVGASTAVQVETIDASGHNTPENFNIVVLCP